MEKVLKFAPNLDYDNNGDGSYQGRTYLHGKLEWDSHTDLCTPLNAIEMGFTKDQISWLSIDGNEVSEVYDENRPRPVMYVNGKFPCEVEGASGPCVGFFWTVQEHPIYYEGKPYPYWEQCGLIVLASDEEGMAQAEVKMRSRSRWM